MTKSRSLTLEHGLYALSVLLGLGLRLVHLGNAPLTDAEASWALQALGKSSQIGAQPGYILLTSLLFSLLTASNFLARLIPALAGGLLSAAPYFLRSRLGHGAALVLAFGLALDPGLVAVSRAADGSTLAVLGVVLAVGLLLAGKPGAAGVFAGLALLGGTRLWPGLLGIGLALLWQKLAVKAPLLVGDADEVRLAFDWRIAGLWAGGTLLVVGTLFFTRPTGLSAAAASLTEYFRGWGMGGGAPLGLLLAALSAYQFFPLLLALAALIARLVRKETDPLTGFLGRWLLVALALALAYPTRTVFDLVWLALPMWTLAALELARLFKLPEADVALPAFGSMLLVILLLVFAWMNASGLSHPLAGNVDNTLRIASLIGAAVLLVVVAVLVSLGWTVSTARWGYARGFVVILLAGLIMSSVSAAGLGRLPENQMWRSGANPQEEDLLVSTLGDVSDRSVGTRGGLDLTVVGDADSPALRWALRDFRSVRYIANLSPDMTPSMVITPDQKELGLSAGYTGQDFAWNQAPTWDLFVGTEWVEWLIFRDAPVQNQTLILWVRSDLFPGATAQPSP